MLDSAQQRVTSLEQLIVSEFSGEKSAESLWFFFIEEYKNQCLSCRTLDTIYLTVANWN